MGMDRATLLNLAMQGGSNELLDAIRKNSTALNYMGFLGQLQGLRSGSEADAELAAKMLDNISTPRTMEIVNQGRYGKHSQSGLQAWEESALDALRRQFGR